jgi:hypothetical protein
MQSSTRTHIHKNSTQKVQRTAIAAAVHLVQNGHDNHVERDSENVHHGGAGGVWDVFSAERADHWEVQAAAAFKDAEGEEDGDQVLQFSEFIKERNQVENKLDLRL